MYKLKTLSFDLDGTLITNEFSNFIWYKYIPSIYAERHGISFKEALKRVSEEYEKISDEDVRWYSFDFWNEKLKLNVNKEDLLEISKNYVKYYPEVLEVLEKLKGKYELIIISNASREFLDVGARKIRKYFSKVFSCPSEFKSVKNPRTYLEICETLKILPEEVAHFGDNFKLDYVYPKSARMNACLVDRNGELGIPDSVKDLKEILSILKKELLNKET